MPTSPTSSTALPRPRKSLNPAKRIPSTSTPIDQVTTTTSPSTTSPLQPSRQTNMQPPQHHPSAELGNGQPSKTTSGTGQSKRIVSALAIQGQAGRNKGKRLSAVMPSAPVVSMEVMNTNFEEWMKLATDNKITANNTWNFALIDYFADLTLLRNDEDQSINFQKASCTLDGCVKIWTSRVDSVATETGKLLSGLAGGNGGGDDEERDGDEEEGEEGEGGVVKTRKTTYRSESTLAKSFATLQIKKFDLEFTVDPLFKKTSADFDEGGAMGLLMNHLGVDGRGRVVFDAGDAGIEEEEEGLVEEDELVDLSKLRDFVPSDEQLQSAVISETLSSFRFSSDPNSLPDFAALLTHSDHDTPHPSRPSTPLNFSNLDDQGQGAQHEPLDFFNDENFDLPPPMGFDDDALSQAEVDGEEGGAGGGGVGGFGRGIGMALPGEGGLSAFDPSKSKRGELVMALVGDGGGGNGMGGGEGDDEDGGGLFGYFDKGFGKSWAGAEHWKLKKVSKKDNAAGPSVPKTTKTAKPAFSIDFSDPSTATSSKTLFTPAPKSTITLPSLGPSRRGGKREREREREKREDWLLPDDMHFSSRQLLRLFLKPKFALRMRKQTANLARMTEGNSGEVDENFWAAAAAERMDGGDADVMDDDSQPQPFASQFFHDDPDDAYVDDALDLPDSTLNPDSTTLNHNPDEAEDLWQGTQGTELKRARPENVHYAKKAKRVDVKRLKDDIWVGLRGLVPEENHTSKEKGRPDLSESTDEDEQQPPPQPTTPLDEVKTFDTVIQNLRTTYPSEKMSEISTSFCFICLLHLANEEGLRIESDRFDGEGFEEERWVGGEGDRAEGGEGVGRGRGRGGGERVVGELQALRVYRDAEAGRGA